MLANLARQFFAIVFLISLLPVFLLANFPLPVFWHFFFVVCQLFFWLLFPHYFFRQFFASFFLFLVCQFFSGNLPFFGQFFIRSDLAQRVFRRFFVFTSIRQFFAIFFIWFCQFYFLAFFDFLDLPVFGQFFNFFGLPVFFLVNFACQFFASFFLANYPMSLYNLLHRKIKTNYLPFTTTSKKRFFKS